MVLAGDTGSIYFDLNDFSETDEVIRSIRALPQHQSQYNIASALEVTREQVFAKDNGDRQDVPNAVIVLSAGRTMNYELVCWSCVNFEGYRNSFMNGTIVRNITSHT